MVLSRGVFHPFITTFNKLLLRLRPSEFLRGHSILLVCIASLDRLWRKLLKSDLLEVLTDFVVLLLIDLSLFEGSYGLARLVHMGWPLEDDLLLDYGLDRL